MHSFIVFMAHYLFLAAPLLFLAAWIRQNSVNKRSLGLRALASAILGIAFARIAGQLHYSLTPFVRFHGTPLLPHVADNGMPSAQTLVAAICAAVLIPYALPEAVAGAVITLLVAWARIASGLHSPYDVALSFVLAALAVGIARVLIRRKPKTGRTASDPGNRPRHKSRPPKLRSSI